MTTSCMHFTSTDLQILKHHIYEYRKGVRNLILHTMKKEEEHLATFLLQNKKISYHIEAVNEHKINVFFGHPQCVEIVRSFKGKMLNKYTPEQDFILGIMLGYGRDQQFDRYLKRIEELRQHKATATS